MGALAQKIRPPQTASQALSKIPRRAHHGPGRMADRVFNLQRMVGNQVVQRLLQAQAEQFAAGPASGILRDSSHDSIQTPSPEKAITPIQLKVTIPSSGDLYEQEADRVADQIMRLPGQYAERADMGRVGHPESRVTEPGSRTVSLPESRIAADARLSSGLTGQPLEAGTRKFMESRFGQEFSKVRIYADTRAAEAARAMNARAYTFGPNVVFGEGQFAPGTDAGNRLLAHELAHVVQQAGRSAVVQRQKADKPAGGGDLQLPWKHGDWSLFEETISSIRFLVAVGNDQEKAIRAAIPAIGKLIAADNSKLRDSSSRVMICIIAPTTTRFALWNGKPVLALDPSDVNVETAAHEMGHALFASLQSLAESKSKEAGKAREFRLTVADIYARLSQTKDVTIDTDTHAAGLWIADPSQWAPGSRKEHPWDDPDEFFASAKAAYQTNRKGFESAIARFTKIDSAVRAPARDLLALLDAFFEKGRLPSGSLPEARATAAQAALERLTGVSKVEETILPDTPLDWLLRPENRPKQRIPRPSIESPY